jgi:hypothetical protein
MRTARSRISGEKRFDFLLMAPSSQSVEPPQNPGRFICVSADPAALFAAFDAVGLFNVLDAALAALLEVSLFGALRWDSALPAADFAALLLLGDVSVFAAFLATVLDVTSFFAIHISPVM